MRGRYSRRRPPPRQCAFLHFQRRVRERVVPHCAVDARRLFDSIVADIESGEPAVLRFVGRTLDKARRLWLMDIEGTTFGVIYDHSLKAPVTIIRDFRIERNPTSKCVLVKSDVRVAS